MDAIERAEPSRLGKRVDNLVEARRSQEGLFTPLGLIQRGRAVLTLDLLFA